MFASFVFVLNDDLVSSISSHRLGLVDKWNDNGAGNGYYNGSQEECHFEILPSHLFFEVRTALLKDRSLFVELIGLFVQGFRLFGILEHSGNVGLHLSLDGIDLSQNLGCLVDLAGVFVLFADLFENAFGFLGQRVGSCGLGVSGKLAHKVRVKLVEAANGDAGLVASASNDSAANTILIASICHLMDIRLDDLEASNLVGFANASGRIIRNNPFHSLAKGIVSATGRSTSGRLVGVVILGQTDGIATLFQTVHEDATKSRIRHFQL